MCQLKASLKKQKKIDMLVEYLPVLINYNKT